MLRPDDRVNMAARNWSTAVRLVSINECEANRFDFDSRINVVRVLVSIARKIDARAPHFGGVANVVPSEERRAFVPIHAWDQTTMKVWCGK